MLLTGVLNHNSHTEFVGPRLSAGYSGNDRHRFAVGHRSLHAVHVADVFVVNEHVHKASQLAVIEQAVGESGVRTLERRQHSLNRAWFNFDFGLTCGQRTKGGGNANSYCHGNRIRGQPNSDNFGRE